MNLKNYLSTWSGALAENRFHRVTQAMLAVALLVALFMATNKNERIILQPMTLDSEAWIEEASASRSYKESFGLYLAMLTGNVTPKNASWIKQQIEPLLDGRIYTSAIEAIERQVAMIKENRLTYRFEVKSVEYEVKTDKVFVYGYSFVRAATGDEQRRERTFEYELKIGNYTPKIMHLDTYEGRPRTIKVLASMQEREARDAKRSVE